MGEVVQTDVDRFDADVAGGAVVVDFTAEWCAPCRALEPVLRQIADETDVRIVQVDVDRSVELVRRFAVRGAPTMLFLRDGVERSRLSGYRHKDAILRELGALQGAGR